MPTQQPTITFRTQKPMGASERLKIQIDGKIVGDIGNNDELVVATTRGSHTITSKYFWTSKALPLDIIIHDDEQIDISIEPSPVKKRYFFYTEPKIPQTSLLSEHDLRLRDIIWDLGNNFLIRKKSDGIIYFDMPNHAYLHPLRFEFDPKSEKMIVFANRKQQIQLYESHVEWFDTYEGDRATGQKAKVHSFIKDDELLGYLFKDNDNWFISSSDLNDLLAEISFEITEENKVFIEDHYLKSLTWENTILAYKKTPRSNYMQIQNMNVPKVENQEILMLAYIKFSLLSEFSQEKKR